MIKKGQDFKIFMKINEMFQEEALLKQCILSSIIYENV